jgi:hypothetical protein
LCHCCIGLIWSSAQVDEVYWVAFHTENALIALSDFCAEDSFSRKFPLLLQLVTGAVYQLCRIPQKVEFTALSVGATKRAFQKNIDSFGGMESDNAEIMASRISKLGQLGVLLESLHDYDKSCAEVHFIDAAPTQSDCEPPCPNCRQPNCVAQSRCAWCFPGCVGVGMEEPESNPKVKNCRNGSFALDWLNLHLTRQNQRLSMAETVNHVQANAIAASAWLVVIKSTPYFQENKFKRSTLKDDTIRRRPFVPGIEWFLPFARVCEREMKAITLENPSFRAISTSLRFLASSLGPEYSYVDRYPKQLFPDPAPGVAGELAAATCKRTINEGKKVFLDIVCSTLEHCRDYMAALEIQLAALNSVGGEVVPVPSQPALSIPVAAAAAEAAEAAVTAPVAAAAAAAAVEPAALAPAPAPASAAAAAAAAAA